MDAPEKTREKVKSDAVQKEEKILAFWQDNDIFKKSLNKPASAGNFVFYDGPPFATGLPHYGHILPGTIKDVIPRYQTMRGKKVLRRWGWDCHGLPIENLIEKELGLSSKKDIDAYGIGNFNLKARGAVMRYADEWKKIIPRSGRWVDMDNDYKTMDSTYTESVWWSFKTLFDKGLVYKSFKSMHICPHCETTLSNFEVNQGYKDITDISVYIKFELQDEPGTFLLAWTTTPWTLPGNVALAVNIGVQYVKVKKDGQIFILAKDLAEKVLKEKYEVVEEFSGEKLLGKAYKPVFSYYDNDKLEHRDRAWKVYAGDFVTTTDGTGIVHIAPAFGEDDMNLGKTENLPFIQHVSMDGTFKKEVTDFAGQKVKPKDDHQKADIEIIKYLAGKRTLFAKEKIIHSYPHCWRCGTPLLNYATTSWFVKVTDLKDKMVELNKKIRWNPPEIGEGRFGKWLEGARDWAISRSRYWGAPLPVWENEEGKMTVIGSIEELKHHIGRHNRYFFVRHGESESNVNGDLISCKKEDKDPLTEIGREESKKSADELASEKIDLIISSPFQRTKETAEIIAKAVGIDPKKIVYEDRLGEISCGKYDRMPWSEFNTEYFMSSEERFTKKIDGVETLTQVYTRSMQALYEIDAQYEGKNIVIISHGGPLSLLRLGAQGLSLKDIAKHYFDNPFYNAEIMRCDFVPLPHNETFELDLHRPYIDEVKLKDDTGAVLKRVPEVFDTWYDSGSMPFAQAHYPFEHKELFEKNGSPLFPADFIAEGLDQTRGWFYTLLVLSTGLFEKSSYDSVIVNGLILAEDGRKMSKSLNNYPDVMYIINTYGADSLRYYLLSSPVVRAEDLAFSEKGVDEVYKKIVQKLYNVLSFYQMYKTPYKKDLVPQGTILDSWVLSRLGELRDTVTASLDTYDLDKATRPIMDFVEDLSVWYIRRSRDRFKSSNKVEQETVSQTTAFVLIELSKIIAPIMPFLAEELYKEVSEEEQKESVHLEDWPELSGVVRDTEIISQMERVRDVVTKVLELRQKANLKVRQPLASLTISETFSPELLDIIADEVNVKSVKHGTDIILDTNITDELKAEGLAREIIRAIQDIRKKEKFDPNKTISVTVSADEFLKHIFELHSQMIQSATLIQNITYSTEKQTHMVDIEGYSLSISISI